MREHWVVALLIVVLGAVLVCAILRERFVQYPQMVSVSATAAVPYTPDTALVRLGVSVDRVPTAAAALERLSGAMQNIVPALVAAGISEDAIVTEAYTLSPQFDYPNGVMRAVGYSASQQVVVTVTGDDLGKAVSDVIAVSNQNGVNQVMGISFEVSDVEALKQEALVEAIALAREKAHATAHAADVHLSDVVGWWETVIQAPGEPVPGPYYDKASMGGEMAANQSGIPAGSQEVIMQVSLNFEVK